MRGVPLVLITFTRDLHPAMITRTPTVRFIEYPNVSLLTQDIRGKHKIQLPERYVPWDITVTSLRSNSHWRKIAP